jgi:hypothetical protein
MPKRKEIDPDLKDSDIPVRSTVEMRGSTYYRVYSLTREYNLSIGQVLDQLMTLATADEDTLRKQMDGARRDKKLNQLQRKDVMRGLASATPRQLDVMAAILAGDK